MMIEDDDDDDLLVTPFRESACHQMTGGGGEGPLLLEGRTKTKPASMADIRMARQKIETGKVGRKYGREK
jgi:hypothetical protein